jgi:hypothetical protein
LQASLTKTMKLVSDVLEFKGYDIFKAVDAEEAQVA